jgi:hypothetical protein
VGLIYEKKPEVENLALLSMTPLELKMRYYFYLFCKDQLPSRLLFFTRHSLLLFCQSTVGVTDSLLHDGYEFAKNMLNSCCVCNDMDDFLQKTTV